MTDDTFAFVIHPIDPKRDISRKYPTLSKLPVWLLEFLSIFYPPVYLSEVTGVRSATTGKRLRGWFLACPLTPHLMMKLPSQVVYHKIAETGRMAERLGARILGLGAFTSVVGDGGLSVSRQLSIPVTTGDSLTVAVAIQAVRDAARRMDTPIESSTVAVVGAYGAIGRVCAQMLAGESEAMLLIGRDLQRLDEVAVKVKENGCRRVMVSDDINRLQEAHLVITVTSAIDTVIEPHHLRTGAVVCDVARPRDVSRAVAEQRPDVLVIEGGMVSVPGVVDFGFDFGFPPRMAYACMAETMALALEGRYECFTLGKRIELAQVRAIDRIASTHGFRLGGLRSFERAVTEAEIFAVHANSRASLPSADPQPLAGTA